MVKKIEPQPSVPNGQTTGKKSGASSGKTVTKRTFGESLRLEAKPKRSRKEETPQVTHGALKSKPVSVRVAVEPKPVPVDWNVWHKPMMDSIHAFGMDGALYLVTQNNICYRGQDNEPVTAQTLYSDLTEMCEILIGLHVNHWVNGMGRPSDKMNIYRDEAGTLLAQMNFSTGDDVSGAMLEPALTVRLNLNSEVGPWFGITFEMVSQQPF